MAAIIHKVKRGETTAIVCLLFGLNYEQLRALNIKFMGLSEYDSLNLKPGDYVVVGDSADPLDLVRIINRRGRL